MIFLYRVSLGRRCRRAGITSISEHVIRTVLQRAGFKRRIARAKPPISEINRQKRLLRSTTTVRYQYQPYMLGTLYLVGHVSIAEQ